MSQVSVTHSLQSVAFFRYGLQQAEHTLHLPTQTGGPGAGGGVGPGGGGGGGMGPHGAVLAPPEKPLVAFTHPFLVGSLLSLALDRPIQHVEGAAVPTAGPAAHPLVVLGHHW